MRSIFHYPGAKSRVAVQQMILGLFPKSYAEYREAFVGGGGIFFGVPQDKRRWVNDMDAGLVAVYERLSAHPEAFIALCQTIEPYQKGELLTSAREGGVARISARLKDVFDGFVEDKNADPALRYFFVNRHVWLGRVRYGRAGRLYFSDPNGWSITRKPLMRQAGELLRGVRVTCGDYERLLTEPGDRVVVYLDPPYFYNTELKEDNRMYEHNFSWDDHRRFAEAVARCPHDVVISYDDCPLVRELFSDRSRYSLFPVDWSYSGSPGEAKKRGRELLIINFDPARCQRP